MLKVLTAPDQQNRSVSGARIFLSGGITDCYNWQQDVIDHLKYFQEFYPAVANSIVYNPRRDDFGELSEDNIFEQIKWEHNYLEKCTVLAVFFDSSKSVQPITLYELGKYADKKDHVITISDGYKRQNDVLFQTALDNDICHVYPRGIAPLEHARMIAQKVQYMYG